MPFPAPYIRSLRVAGVAGASLALVGLLVLTGWLSGTRALPQVFVGWRPMVPLTAVMFVFSGVALLANTFAMSGGEAWARSWRRVAFGLGVVVGGVGLRRLVYYLFGWRSEIDMLGFEAYAGPGRMAVLAATGFVLSGCALAATARRVFNPAAQAAAGLVFFLGLSTATRYLYGGEVSGEFYPISLPSALLFMILGAGIFFARPDGGFVMMWNGDTAGASLLRRLFLASLLVPVVVGWFRLLGQRAGSYSFETGLAIFAMSNVLIFAALAWHTAHRLHREDLRRREAEGRLRESEANLRHTVELNPQVPWTADTGGAIRDFSPRWLTMTGLTREEALGGGWMRAPHAEDLPLMRAAWEKSLATGEPYDIEHRIRMADGGHRWMRSRAFPRRDEAGRIVAWYGTTEDIDEAWRARAALRESEEKVRLMNAQLERRVAERTAELQAKNRELETFTYSVSHDLKAPLRGIDGYGRLLEETHAARLDDEGRHFLASVRQATRHMGQLIDDLLAYSQIERRAIILSPVRPKAILDALPCAFRDELRERGVRYEVDLPEQAVAADAAGLAQVLGNLLDNALKFTRGVPEPAIRVEGAVREGKYLLSVRDNGTGFDMKFAERIFEIFQRLHRAEDYPGTGVGLAIVRKAVERMGGRVWARSEPGKGAAFFIELPLSS